VKDCHPVMHLHGISNVKAKIGTDRLSKNHFFSSCSYNSQLASWHLQLTDFSEDGGPLTVDLRGFLRSSITSPDAPPGITSWDVLPSLTSRRSRPRLLPKAALRPGTVLASLASDLEVVFISELTKKNYIWRNASMNVPISQLSKMLKSK